MRVSIVILAISALIAANVSADPTDESIRHSYTSLRDLMTAAEIEGDPDSYNGHRQPANDKELFQSRRRAHSQTENNRMRAPVLRSPGNSFDGGSIKSAPDLTGFHTVATVRSDSNESFKTLPSATAYLRRIRSNNLDTASIVKTIREIVGVAQVKGTIDGEVRIMILQQENKIVRLQILSELLLRAVASSDCKMFESVTHSMDEFLVENQKCSLLEAASTLSRALKNDGSDLDKHRSDGRKRTRSFYSSSNSNSANSDNEFYHDHGDLDDGYDDSVSNRSGLLNSLISFAYQNQDGLRSAHENTRPSEMLRRLSYDAEDDGATPYGSSIARQTIDEMLQTSIKEKKCSRVSILSLFGFSSPGPDHSKDMCALPLSGYDTDDLRSDAAGSDEAYAADAKLSERERDEELRSLCFDMKFDSRGFHLREMERLRSLLHLPSLTCIRS